MIYFEKVRGYKHQTPNTNILLLKHYFTEHMDGKFPSSISDSIGSVGTGSSAVGHVSGAASVSVCETPSMEASVNSAESESLMKSPLLDTEMNRTDSGNVSVEVSLLTASVDTTSTMNASSNSDSNHPGSNVEPINPFDLVRPQSSVVSTGKRNGQSSTTDGSVSPVRAVSVIVSDSAAALPSSSSPQSPAQGNDSSEVPLNSTPSADTPSTYLPPQTDFISGDDHTEPSSALASTNPGDHASSTDGQDTLESDEDQNRRSSIVRFIGNTRRLVTNRRDAAPDSNDLAEHVRDIDDELLDEKNGSGSLISGYLKKLGRNGKWQTRWFETDGECLSYFKDKKRTKVLATLDLDKVSFPHSTPRFPHLH